MAPGQIDIVIKIVKIFKKGIIMHIGSLKACSLQKIVTMSLLTVTAVLALQGQAFAGQNQKTKVYKEQSPNGDKRRY